MTDIVERLRHEMMPAAMSATRRAILQEAAAEIERLLAVDVNSKEAALWSETMSLKSRNEWLKGEIARLRAALQSLTTDPPPTLDEPDTDAEVVIKMRAIARRALEPKP